MTMRSKSHRVSTLTIVLLAMVSVDVALLAQRYSAKGKRDPFISLAARRKELVIPKIPPLHQRPPGLPGLLISEVTVAGMAVRGNARIAILKGVDKFTYLAQENSKLFDGHVSQIEANKVVFTREDANSDGSSTSSSKVVKQLYTEDQQVKGQ